MAWTDFFPFLNTPPMREVTGRIDTLEASGGAGLPDSWYETVAEIRAITGYLDNDVVALTNGVLYQFDAASTAVDDGAAVLIPNDITHPAPGRWLRIVTFSLAGHTHTDKLNVPTAEASDQFIMLNATKDIVASGKGINSFVEDANYVHTDNNFEDTYKTQLDNLGEIPDVTDKMDKVTPTAGNLGDITVLDENGNAIESGIKPDELIKISSEADVELSAPGAATFVIALATAFDFAEVITGIVYGTNKVGLKITIDNQGNVLQRTPSHRDTNNQLNTNIYTVTSDVNSGNVRVILTFSSVPGTITIKAPKTILL